MVADDAWLDGLAARAVDRLATGGWSLGIAESLTGGALAARLVGVPGASAVLRGAVVAYATDLKASLLGVPPSLLAAVGPVHAKVAAAMAGGARTRLGADLGLATTGVAGPACQGGHAPGTIHAAVAWEGGGIVRSAVLAGPRPQVRAAAVGLALSLLLGAVGEMRRQGGEVRGHPSSRLEQRAALERWVE